MLEKDLYPTVENFLKPQKNCPVEYVGTELTLKRGKTSLRADVFGVSNDGEKTIYLCEIKMSASKSIIEISLLISFPVNCIKNCLFFFTA